MKNERISIEATIDLPVNKVWQYWTNPIDIMQWNNASPDWHTPSATNELHTGGTFVSRMEAKDGSMGFDFSGIYDEVNENNFIKYTLADARIVEITFADKGNQTSLTETFEAEQENSLEMQKAGWQAILDNFKKYAENKG